MLRWDTATVYTSEIIFKKITWLSLGLHVHAHFHAPFYAFPSYQ